MQFEMRCDVLGLIRDYAHPEIYGERVIEHSLTACFLQGGHDFEPTRSEDDGDGDPEAAVGGEDCRTKGVSNGHFPSTYVSNRYQGKRAKKDKRKRSIPHPSQKLYQTTIRQRRPHQYIRHHYILNLHLDETQEEDRVRKGKQSQWGGVCNFAILRRLVKTRLKLDVFQQY